MLVPPLGVPRFSREEWARDFEKLEAVAYHKAAAASEDISEVEAKRLLEAVEAATTKEQTSIGLLQNFMSQSGDPAISYTFREIQMEAVTLPSARNDATRRAAKANSRLVKTCAPKFKPGLQNLSKTHSWITRKPQTPALQQHYSTQSTQVDFWRDPGLPGLKTKLEDNVFNSGRISDASAYLKDYPDLQWPDGAPAAIALTRVEILALRPGMVVPIL